MADFSFEAGIDFARLMDRQDPLVSFRDRFHIPKAEDGTDTVYLCGNSLGLQPTNAADYVSAELEKWRHLGVKGHFDFFLT